MHPRDFDYDLPSERIAQHPVTPRDAARLLVLDRRTGAVSHCIFRDLPELLAAGDLLVLNDTRVLPARLLGRRPGTGGRVELLLLRRLAIEPGGRERWEVLCRPGRRLRAGEKVGFGAVPDGSEPPELTAVLGPDLGDGVREATLRVAGGGPVEPALERIGQMPLPPYITAPLGDPGRYQTVYARDPGSAAAPTAGLHFTRELFDRLASAGIETTCLTLHVGLGTFRPVQAERVEEHRMHAEFYTLPEPTAAAIAAARRRGGRVVAVGTTVARTLEASADGAGGVRPGSGWTEIFICPGYRFQVLDALITNFHLPRSTLVMLVSGFAGRERTIAAYREAIELGYRFYSFGDAMLIL